MGGCCCFSSGRSEGRNTPEYCYGPRASEEHIPLSPYHIVDTNLETLPIDTYAPPPQPVAYDGDSMYPHTLPGILDIRGNKSSAEVLTINSESTVRLVGNNSMVPMEKCEALKGADCKTEADIELASLENLKVEIPKSTKTILVEEEDDCPICLEEYDAENPKCTTKCEHHFHLACILEWMERSDTCPVCDREMVFSPPIDD